jgi:hypothetical protein
MYEDDLYDIERDMVKWEQSIDTRFDCRCMFDDFDGITDIEYLVNNTRVGTNVKK